jgi:hypothetical protein
VKKRAEKPIDLITFPNDCLTSHQCDEGLCVSAIENVPPEILEPILSYLTISSKINLAPTSKHMASLMNDKPGMLSFDLTYHTTAQNQSIVADEAFAGWELDADPQERKVPSGVSSYTPRSILPAHVHVTCTSCEPAAESLFDHTKKHLTTPSVPECFDKLIL